MNKIKALVISFLLLCSQVSAGGGGIGGAATEVTQMRNNVELVAQVFEQVKTVEELVKQLEIMMINIEGWEEIFSGNGMDLLLRLAEAVKRNRIIAYSGASIEEQFEEAFPGYEAYLEVEAPEWTPEFVDEQYRLWNESHRNSITAAMEAVQLHHENYDNEMAIIEALELQTATSAGRQQALVAANEIAVEQLKQAKSLKQMIMTQVQLQSNFMAYRQNEETAAHARRYNLMKDMTESQDEIILDDGAPTIYQGF